MVDDIEGGQHGPEGLEGSTLAVIVFGIVVVIIIAAVGVILVQELASTGSDYDFSELIEEEHQANSNTVLSVTTVNGYISIHSWDQNRINISALKYAQHEEDLVKLDLQVTKNGNEIAITVTHTTPSQIGNEGINLDLKVPYAATIESLTSTNGEIDVADMSLVKDVSTANGAVNIELVGAVHRVNTTNGAIAVEIQTMNNPVSLSTTNGAIDVHILTSLDATVHMETLNGHISIHDVTLTLTLDEPHHKEGALGNGGNLLKITTTNGDISLHDLA